MKRVTYPSGRQVNYRLTARGQVREVEGLRGGQGGKYLTGGPVEDGHFQVGAGVGVGDGDRVIVHGEGDEGPAVVFAFFDEVAFVAATGAVFEFLEFAVGGEGEASGGAVRWDDVLSA